MQGHPTIKVIDKITIVHLRTSQNNVALSFNYLVLILLHKQNHDQEVYSCIQKDLAL